MTKPQPTTKPTEHKPDTDPRASFLRAQAQQLNTLLGPEPFLREKLTEVLASGAWFITLSFQKRLKPDDEHDLHHTYCIAGYPPGDVVNTLKHLAADFQSKNFPGAQLDAEGWF